MKRDIKIANAIEIILLRVLTWCGKIYDSLDF